MRLIQLISIIILGFFALSCSENSKFANKSAYDFVNPFIGTGGHGHTFPGATTPYGMVQLSPDTRLTGWDGCSGYHYTDSIIYGFSHTHLSGTGISDYCDVLLMPFNEEKTISLRDIENQGLIPSLFKKDSEKANPGYYTVHLEKPDVTVELTSTTRVGIHKYKFNKKDNNKILLDLNHRDKVLKSEIKIESNNAISGLRQSQSWASNQHVYFYMEFSEEFSLESPINKASDLYKILNFKEIAEIIIKVGISSVSVENAKENLKTEADSWDFDLYKNNAKKTWQKALNKIEVKGTNEDKLSVFYTALYHTMIAPNTFSDANGDYRGMNQQIHNDKVNKTYTVFSLWDTFRAAHPLFTILQPERVSDMIVSMLNIYSEQGKLPVWSLMANETNTMIGYHSVPVIADAMFKGIEGFDHELAYKAAKHSSTLDFEGLHYYRRYNFIPADLENESVSKTLEYCYDDWCIAQMAKMLDKTEDYNYYMKRSKYFENIFDPETGFIRGRLSNGNWKEPFDPLYSSHRQDEYTEGNAWQYTWFVPHDIYGLAELMGGVPALIQKLDSLFLQEEGVKGEDASSDISGLIGAYAHGNEPGHHTAYIFSHIGTPHRTQELVRKIMTEMYHSGKDGLCGNEDCGQMSAWYVFSAMGFYPFNPADGAYVIGSPLLDKVSISLPENKEFIIVAENNSPENIYISKVMLNGKEIDRKYINHEEIMSGGELVFTMTDKK